MIKIPEMQNIEKKREKGLWKICREDERSFRTQ